MRLLITRPAEDAAPLAEALTRKGHEVLLDALIEIVPMDPMPTLALDDVQAVLLTSANGARALATATERRDIKLLAVGERTAVAARDAGFGDVTSANGDVEDLTKLAIEELDPAKGRVLHVGGAAVAGDLVGALGKAKFQAERVALYEARAATVLGGATIAAMGRGDLDGVLLFSPRTAATFADLVKAADLDKACRALTAYCLSPAVGAALGGLQFGAVRVAERPEQDSLLALIDTAAADAPPPPSPRAPLTALLWPAVAALAIVVAGAALYAWPRGGGPVTTAATDPVVIGRVGALETRLRAAESAVMEARQMAADRAPVDALAARLATLEARLDRVIAAPPPAVPDALVQRLDAIEAKQAELVARGDATTVTATPDANVERRLFMLEERLAAVARLDRAATGERDAARRVALAGAAVALRGAASGSGGFQPALDTVKSLAEGDMPVLATLEPIAAVAAKGVATRPALRERFTTLASALVRAPDTGDAQWYDRAWHRVAGLVTLRRTGELAGGDAEAIVARAEVKLASNDLHGAVAELATLSPGPAAVAAPWLNDAKARLAVDDALQRLDAAIAVQAAKK